MHLLLEMPGPREVMIVFIFLGLLLIPKIFFIITLQSTLQAIAPENRKMPLANVWLLLIPIFSLAWNFIVVNNMADAIKAELAAKQIHTAEARPAYDLGLAMCILDCICLIPIVNFLAGIGAIICWILYWLKINGYKTQIINTQLPVQSL